MTETRIRWDETRTGTLGGYVGTMTAPAFRIRWIVSDEHGWTLTTYLPLMIHGKRDRADDPDELKAEAERWLEEFVVSLGAVFPDALDCSAVTRFEVINHTTGSKHLVSYSPDAVRSVVARNVKVDLAFQDDGQTVKVFLADPRPAATAADTEE